MKNFKIIISALMIFLSLQMALPQSFVVDTLLYNGDKSKLINIVLMGDGYLADEQENFVVATNTIKDYFFSQGVFGNYKNYFNVFAIEVPSNESGTNHPGTSPDPDCPQVPVSTADNYFGSTFDAFGIHRLVCIENYDLAANVLADNFPEYDIVLIVVNSPYYGGSGGTYAVSTTHTNSNEVSLHEIGHSFGTLADEYWSGWPWEAPNQTQNSDPLTIRWKNWLYDNGIGIYAFAENSSWFRPHQNCKMRYLNVPFCSVCTERLIENIHGLVNPVYSYFPSNVAAIEADTALLSFGLNLLKPIPNTLKTTWNFDGNTFLFNMDDCQINPDTIANGNHQLIATIIDTTEFSRDEDHWILHLFNIEWDILKTQVGLDINAQANQTDILVYPNPFADNLSIAYHIDHDTKVGIEIIDTHGKILKRVINKKQEAGNYELNVDIAEIGHNTGTYFLRFSFNDYIIIKPIIHKA